MKKRIHYLDNLRILATVAVMVIHVSGQHWSDVPVGSATWNAFNIFDGMAHWAVPLFVMISGALFLGREIELGGGAGADRADWAAGGRKPLTLKQLYGKYVLRLVTAFAFWSVVYAFLGSGNGQTRLHRLIVGHYHMWFILMLAGIYICLPFLAMIAQNEKLCNYYLVIGFICTFAVPQFRLICTDFAPTVIVRTSEAINQFVNNFGISAMFGYPFYFVLGYKLSKIDFEGSIKGGAKGERNGGVDRNRQQLCRSEKLICKNKYLLPIIVLGFVGLILTPLLTYIKSMKLGYGSTDYYGNFTINILMVCVALFVGFKALLNNSSSSYAKQENVFTSKQTKDKNEADMPKAKISIVSTLSDWSFGAYLVHAMVLEKLSTICGINTLSLWGGFIGAVLSIVIITIIVFIISFAISGILHHIPVVKKYLV